MARSDGICVQKLVATLVIALAFLGVDAEDDRGAARTFLRDRPLPYPSFDDPDQKIAATQGAAVGYPRTAFYDAGGRLVHLKQGPYTSAATVAADVRRYAVYA